MHNQLSLPIVFILCGCIAPSQQTQYEIDETILSDTEIRQSIRDCETKNDDLWASQIKNLQDIASSVTDGYITPQDYAELILSAEKQHRLSREMCSTIANLSHRELQEYLDSLQ